jgi:hypothetical protein
MSIDIGQTLPDLNGLARQDDNALDERLRGVKRLLICPNSCLRGGSVLSPHVL